MSCRDADIPVRGLAANDYCNEALGYLSHAYDARRAVFACASRIGRRGEVSNDFAMPLSLRYTINAYLGLSEAERHGGEIEWLGPVRPRVGEFASAYETAIVNCGDRGLLLTLLAATERTHPAVERTLQRLERVVARRDAAQRLNIQELAWMLWGATSWASEPRAQALAQQIFDLIRGSFVHRGSGMPKHSTARYRAHAVSFGGIVYFLRALHEYGEAFDSAEARQLFSACVDRVLAIQRADGAWPWMIDVRSATPIDVYPIFSVHQDSMAMLFLFPAEHYRVAGVRPAIERSLQWNLGHNELETPMLRHEPYAWFYRSIERTERWPRVRRYLRGFGPRASLRPTDSPRVRLNRECRSYHPGWILYAWSGRADMPRLSSSVALNRPAA